MAPSARSRRAHLPGHPPLLPTRLLYAAARSRTRLALSQTRFPPLQAELTDARFVPCAAGQAAYREARLPSSDGASPQWRNREHAFLGAVGRQPLGYPSIRLRHARKRPAWSTSVNRVLSQDPVIEGRNGVRAARLGTDSAPSRTPRIRFARPFGAFSMARMATFAGEMPFFCRSKAAVRRLQHGYLPVPVGLLFAAPGFRRPMPDPASDARRVQEASPCQSDAFAAEKWT